MRLSITYPVQLPFAGPGPSRTPDFAYRVYCLPSPTLMEKSGDFSVPTSNISRITGPRYPEGSRNLRFPDYVTMAQDVGKVVSLTHRPLFTPRKDAWYSFLLEAESTPGP